MNDAAAGSKPITIALAGNPNAGKTTLFNSLTGLRQKVANYPGVTVERKSGPWMVGGESATLVDLPGLYSLDATSLDERIAREIILGERTSEPLPDVIVAVVDAANLERNLYLATQLIDTGVPVVIALTMIDVLEKSRHSLDIAVLSNKLGVPVVAVNAKTAEGLDTLAGEVHRTLSAKQETTPSIAGESTGDNSEIFARYKFISDAVQAAMTHGDTDSHRISERIDSVLTHKFFGLVILVGILLLLFQTIFSWASLPMDLLDQTFGAAAEYAKSVLPEGIVADLVADGIIAGVGGVMVFLPQILLMFLFISILEDTGYMARAAFLLDKLMSRVGLHGKAFLPLMSSFACAIPGIMATRTIENSRDRIATIMIAPFMSCSARLPVYTLMIATVFAGQTWFGFLSVGAVLMLAMYAIGIFVAVAVAWILKRTILNSPPPPFLMELPPYRMPNFRTVFINMLSRASMFIKRAGTVILLISIVLWALMYFPRTDEAQSPLPNVQIPNSNVLCPVSYVVSVESPQTLDPLTSAGDQLRNSYAGQMGRAIEPAIAPLGFDWKVGVAIIASFAAREVLVSTLSIIYNVGRDETEESETLVNAVRNAKRDDGRPVWTPLSALSLMVFFVLAMQCMSTLAIVRRETNSWTWPALMFAYMTALAYIAALITYQTGKALGFE